MKIIRGRDVRYEPASHEDPKRPGLLRKVLLKRDGLLAGRIQMINWALLPKGKSFRAHYHENLEEVFVMIAGKAILAVNGEEMAMKRGDAVVIPPKSVHTMRNIGDENVEYIVIGIVKIPGGRTVIVF